MIEEEQAMFGPKTQALLEEDYARRHYRPGAFVQPRLDRDYLAGDLPPGSVVRWTTSCEYVIGRAGMCMKWEQPIPGSEQWTVTYVGRLPEGDWMTPRQRAEVDEGRAS